MGVNDRLPSPTRINLSVCLSVCLSVDILVGIFACVGLETNVQKTQTMICTPGRICTQLLTALYQRMRKGLVSKGEWDSRKVKCHQCNKMMAASSLRRHLVDQHEIYQQVVVAEELLEARAGVTYRVDPKIGGKFVCLVLGCAGKFGGWWMLWRHF